MASFWINTWSSIDNIYENLNLDLYRFCEYSLRSMKQYDSSSGYLFWYVLQNKYSFSFNKLILAIDYRQITSYICYDDLNFIIWDYQGLNIYIVIFEDHFQFQRLLFFYLLNACLHANLLASVNHKIIPIILVWYPQIIGIYHENQSIF
jgi:hypothetical protein